VISHIESDQNDSNLFDRKEIKGFESIKPREFRFFREEPIDVI
jgi:hypothetical protein